MSLSKTLDLMFSSTDSTLKAGKPSNMTENALTGTKGIYTNKQNEGLNECLSLLDKTTWNNAASGSRSGCCGVFLDIPVYLYSVAT